MRPQAVRAQQAPQTLPATAPLLHAFHGTDVRAFTGPAGSFWFVAADIAQALGYRDAHALVRWLEDDEKGTHIVCTPGGDQQQLIVSESGMFAAVLRSRKPAAKEFRRWVTGTVLPSLRAHGVYMLGQEARLPDGLSLEDLEAEARRLQDQAATVQARIAAIVAQKTAELAAARERMRQLRQDRDEAHIALRSVFRPVRSTSTPAKPARRGRR